ncbi:MAG TPA: hypothetical protein VG826_29070 [Pirellulales bacterium]|nr:hypothetical protein [Pirellulales bacterium]
MFIRLKTPNGAPALIDLALIWMVTPSSDDGPLNVHVIVNGEPPLIIPVDPSEIDRLEAAINSRDAGRGR